jgi:hypothetical protein
LLVQPVAIQSEVTVPAITSDFIMDTSENSFTTFVDPLANLNLTIQEEANPTGTIPRAEEGELSEFERNARVIHVSFYL